MRFPQGYRIRTSKFKQGLFKLWLTGQNLDFIEFVFLWPIKECEPRKKNFNFKFFLLFLERNIHRICSKGKKEGVFLWSSQKLFPQEFFEFSSWILIDIWTFKLTIICHKTFGPNWFHKFYFEFERTKFGFEFRKEGLSILLMKKSEFR